MTIEIKLWSKANHQYEVIEVLNTESYASGVTFLFRSTQLHGPTWKVFKNRVVDEVNVWQNSIEVCLSPKEKYRYTATPKKGGKS